MTRGFCVACTAVAFVSSAAMLAPACSSDDSSGGRDQNETDASPAPDASGGDARVTTDSGSSTDDAGWTTGLRFGGEPDGAPYCFPDALPTTSTGQLDCHVVVLEGDAGCGDGGLTPASPSDTSRVAAASGVVSDGTLCVVPQLDPDCVGSNQNGYCYVTGSSCVPDAGADAATCPQSLCPSGDFEPEPSTRAWLLCP